MTTFNHKNIEIRFAETSGQFTATFGTPPKFQRATSLAAMKKKIDASLAETFEPFEALRERRHGDPATPNLVQVRIVGKQKYGRAQRGGFVDENGHIYGSRELLPNTQEARNLSAALDAANAAYSAARSACNDARNAIPYIKFEE